MKRIHLIFLLCFLFFTLLVSCTKSETKVETKSEIKEEIFKFTPGASGVFKDLRDMQTYKWIVLKDGKKWMSQNLKYIMSDSWCPDVEKDRCALDRWCHDGNVCCDETNGRLYTWEAAQKSCPQGWHLPSEEEWWNMTSYYGKAYSYERKNYGSPRTKDAGKTAYASLMCTGDSGFSANLAGYGFHGSYYSGNGVYWTSSLQEDSAWYYSFSPKNSRKNNVNMEEGKLLQSSKFYDKTSALSCRCIHN